MSISSATTQEFAEQKTQLYCLRWRQQDLFGCSVLRQWDAEQWCGVAAVDLGRVVCGSIVHHWMSC